MKVGHSYKKLNECKYMKHIFELRMKDQIEERSSQLLRNLSSCEKKARLSFCNCLSCVVTARIFLLFEKIKYKGASLHKLRRMYRLPPAWLHSRYENVDIVDDVPSKTYIHKYLS